MRSSHEWRSLRQVHWQQLEWSEAGHWPLLLRCLVVGMVFVVALVLGRPLLLAPQQQELQLAQSSEARLMKEFQQLSGELAALEPLTEQARGLEQRLVALGKSRHSASIPALMERIGDLAAEHQLSVETLELLQVDGVEVRKDSLRLNLIGGYHHIAEFVGALADIPIMVTLHDLVLERRDVSQEPALWLSARLEVDRAAFEDDAEMTPLDGRSS